ncbi:MAG: hypothetical protein ABIN15_04700 [candidate division WOR-3 bacterium]
MVKFKLILFILLLITGIPLFISQNFYKSESKFDTKNLEFFLEKNYGEVFSVFAKYLVDPVLLEEKETIGRIVSELRKISGIEYVAVTDINGNFLVSSKPGEEGKGIRDVLGQEVNLEKNVSLYINQNSNLIYLRIPIKLEAANTEKTVGNLVIGLSYIIIKDIFQVQGRRDSPLFLFGIFFISALVIFLLSQILIFSPIDKKIKNYEARERKYLTFENLKRTEEETKISIAKLEERKKELQVEISSLDEKLREKKKELEETDVGKIVKELEEKKRILEEEIEKLKNEEEEVRKRLMREKTEQEELKKRLDIIRQKMKQIMGP